jgi:hypothetical protein
MLLEELQKAWQSQSTPTVSIDADALIGQVRRRQREFKTTIFWRDFREVAVALVLAVVFVMKARNDGWPSLTVSAACLWIAGFILIDRWRRRSRRPASDHALLDRLDEALSEVKHQIWLLKNVAWWYLLPLAVALVFQSAYSAATGSGPVAERLASLAIQLGVFGAVFAGVYWLNQYAVRTALQPRRQELLDTRESLLSMEN